jgi:hypothetical protein
MQSYDGFWPIPTNFVFFVSSLCDNPAKSATSKKTPSEFVAKGHKKGRKR